VQDFINDGNQDVQRYHRRGGEQRRRVQTGWIASDVSASNDEVANVAPVNSVPGAQTMNEDGTAGGLERQLEPHQHQ
jgi:hypothetical protein